MGEVADPAQQAAGDRGVPRERRAISCAPSSVMPTPSSRAARRTTCSSSSTV
jgi:hypothetical protein